MSGQSGGDALARSFLESIAGYFDDPEANTPSQDKPVKLGTVDALYNGTGNPLVLFDGETLMGSRPYPYSTRKPRPSERVVLLPQGRSYVIVGILGDASWGAPFAMAAGTAAVGTIAAGAAADTAIVFPTGRFTQPPIVVGTVGNNRLTVQVGSITTSGFTFRVLNNTTNTTGAGSTGYWQAVQMLSGSAAG